VSVETKTPTELWSLCVECGPNVRTDEDGCCATCGGAAVGTWLDASQGRVTPAVTSVIDTLRSENMRLRRVEKFLRYHEVPLDSMSERTERLCKALEDHELESLAEDIAMDVRQLQRQLAEEREIAKRYAPVIELAQEWRTHGPGQSHCDEENCRCISQRLREKNGPLWMRHAIAILHDMVDQTDPNDVIGTALTHAGLQRRPDAAGLLGCEECHLLRELLADTKFYLKRQDIRAIGGVVCCWDVISPALQERIDSLTKGSGDE
jgi:hypothetical protein